ncbi:hypothetical protein [Dactylosporangium sp. CA-139066]|uniref:hypothetical protein n=1 Tax=Dactylosporangium sp. CA-139066 TaxID=3239930 RepID=UPI003D8EFD77
MAVTNSSGLPIVHRRRHELGLDAIGAKWPPGGTRPRRRARIRFVATRPGQERRLGEDDLDIATVRRRRLAEHERERAALETALRERRTAQLDAEAALRTAAARYTGRVEAMRQRCAGFGHYTEWRIAAYWRSLLRSNRFNRRGGWKPLPEPWPRWALENGVSP